MKKRVLAFLCVIMLCMMNLMTVFASDTHPSRVVDDASLLSSSQQADLQSKLDSISNKYSVDVVIVTTDSLKGKTVTAAADDYFDYNGYGFGSEGDGILLYIAMDEREWAMSTKGFGITAFTDRGLSYIEDKFKPMLSEGEYYKAFDTFADLCDDFIKEAKNGKPYDSGHMPKGKFKVIYIFESLVIGVVMSFIVVSCMKGQLKSVRAKAEATDYIKQGSFNLTTQRDTFLYSNVTSKPKPQNNSGSSTHSSSSGSSHGGSSGSF